MNKAKLIAFMLPIAMTVATAHAAQVMGAPCPSENNGTFGETAMHQGVICANGKWQDVASVPMTSIKFEELDPKSGNHIRSVEMARALGAKGVHQSSDGRSLFLVLATVAAISPDNTAHVVADLDEGSVNRHIDTTVALDTPTVVATGEDGHVFRITVKRIGS